MNNYKRLTERSGKNGIGIKETSTNPYLSIWNAIERLADLEDKIEDGTLIELPCKVGDMVYMIWIDKLDENNAPIHKIQSGNIFAIQLENKEGNLDIWLRVEFGLTYCCRRIGDFYLTKAEAEAKLKELQGK